ncbi:MAG: inorganic phosphate transporter [Candidatus Thermoplasmatota archaeon]|jgi:PiT family inorganic phosphate transporter|nr:inorganic phosphate transporter [Candidatus Thermoplasmatota archaeon]MCL6090699.1 inorganic phosphate transporter [Candidatus Thermoplasmatota archaeon]MDA8143807.1 inorganic phosphate transporter [Thermoplasmatales archaeon]
MLYGYLIIVLAVILTALVSGNNLSAAVGTLIGSRIVSRIGGIIIGILGFTSGLLIQGESLADTATKLIPRSSQIIVFALLIALIIFALATYFRVPLSLIMALVGVSIGLSYRFGYPEHTYLIRIIILTWIIAPLASIALGFALNRKLTGLQPKNVWNFALSLKLALVAVSFLTAFTLGANTLGFIEQISGLGGFGVIYMIIGIVLGSVFLSKGVIRRVGQEMYLMRYTNAFVALIVSSALVEGATLIGLPLSNTQTLTSSVFGTGLSYRNKLMEIRPFLITVATWILSPLLGIICGLLA